MIKERPDISQYSFASISSYTLNFKIYGPRTRKGANKRATNHAFSRSHVSSSQQQQSTIRPALPTIQISTPNSLTTPPNDANKPLRRCFHGYPDLQRRNAEAEVACHRQLGRSILENELAAVLVLESAVSIGQGRGGCTHAATTDGVNGHESEA